MYKLKDILPIILVILLIFWYHSYIIGFIVVFHSTLYVWQMVVYTILFHIFYCMMMWSLIATWTQPIAKVPYRYKLTNYQTRALIRSPDERKEILLTAFYQIKGIKMYCRTKKGNLRFCKICYHFKPDRAHHCRKCDTCILRMDHHCHLLNTCICLTNQKGFLLTLFYFAIFCMYYISTTFNPFLEFWTTKDPSLKVYLAVLVGFTAAAILGPLSSVFCLFHFGLYAQNKTLVEDLAPPTFICKYITYDVGVCNNLIQVLGSNKLLWFIPIFNQEGAGLVFPARNIRHFRKRRSVITRDVLDHRLPLKRSLSDFIR